MAGTSVSVTNASLRAGTHSHALHGRSRRELAQPCRADPFAEELPTQRVGYAQSKRDGDRRPREVHAQEVLPHGLRGRADIDASLDLERRDRRQQGLDGKNDWEQR